MRELVEILVVAVVVGGALEGPLAAARLQNSRRQGLCCA